METLFKLLYKADEALKTEILEGIYFLTRPVLEFNEVFSQIIMQAETFLKVLNESLNYYQTRHVLKIIENMSELYHQQEFINALL